MPFVHPPPLQRRLRRLAARTPDSQLVLDLGTANVRIHRRGHGLVLNEPAVVAVDGGGTVIAAGRTAALEVRRDPAGTRLQRPLRGGVIADFDAAVAMVARFLHAVDPAGRPAAVVVCVPSGITAVERAAFQEVVLAAGARAGFVIEDPIAAAIGTGLEIADETPTMLVDIGAGTTDVAIMSLGSISVSQSAPLGGDDIDIAIAHHLLGRHGVRIGQRAAERIKVALGDLRSSDGPDGRFEVHGKQGDTDTKGSATVTVGEVYTAIDPVVHGMAWAVRTTLDRATPGDAADLLDQDVILTGGTSLLPGLAERIADVTGLTVQVSSDPLSRVAAGAGACLDTTADLAAVFAGAGRVS
jgi:rod shape-determining protein MreB and related proteins